MLILQENNLDKFVKEEVKEREEEEAKSKHKKDMIISKRIIAESIKYHQDKLQKKCLMPSPVYLKG